MTKTISDISGHLSSVEDLLADTTLSAEVRTQLEATKTLLADLKTKFEALLQEIQTSRMKRASGTISYNMCIL